MRRFPTRRMVSPACPRLMTPPSDNTEERLLADSILLCSCYLTSPLRARLDLCVRAHCVCFSSDVDLATDSEAACRCCTAACMSETGVSSSLWGPLADGSTQTSEGAEPATAARSRAVACDCPWFSHCLCDIGCACPVDARRNGVQRLTNDSSRVSRGGGDGGRCV